MIPQVDLGLRLRFKGLRSKSAAFLLSRAGQSLEFLLRLVSMQPTRQLHDNNQIDPSAAVLRSVFDKQIRPTLHTHCFY